MSKNSRTALLQANQTALNKASKMYLGGDSIGDIVDMLNERIYGLRLSTTGFGEIKRKFPELFPTNAPARG